MRIPKPSRRFISAVLGLSLLHLVLLLADGFRPPQLPSDVAVVLGSKVHPDGQPSSGLQRRLERAVQLFQAHAVSAIIVSGGRGMEGFEEADVMQEFLRKAGIPPQNIITDRTGNNTRLTAIHAAAILHARHWRSAVVVTQYYHVPRAKLALRQQGIPQVSGSAAEYRFAWTDPLSILRECAGFYAYLWHPGVPSGDLLKLSQ
ncbi:MAG: YdcF family protein [Bryobacteraceae bacterium]